MAKPVIKFTAAPYEVNGYKGYRPQLESQGGVYDLDFCKEVVEAKRLAMSAEELLHAMEMAGEVAASKLAQDGRPRGITKLIKWNRYAKGNLESPSSPWNASCKAVIRAQLMADAEKEIDATFQNVTSGIGVKLNDVTYVGAKSVQNVIKLGVPFAANGSHMEFLEGDEAYLEVGKEKIPLTCNESDVSRALFDGIEAFVGYEPGMTAVFHMSSRGGVEDGRVYPTKKQVTLVGEASIPGPKITTLKSSATGNEGEWKLFADRLEITGTGFTEDTSAKIQLVDKVTGAVEATVVENAATRNVFTRLSDTEATLEYLENTTACPDGMWQDRDDYDIVAVLFNSKGEAKYTLTPID